MERAITSIKYANVFGFMQEEVFEAMYEFGLLGQENEVRRMFRGMIRGWFKYRNAHYNNFVKTLLQGNLDVMNVYINEVALTTFSFFDTGKSLRNRNVFTMALYWDCW